MNLSGVQDASDTGSAVSQTTLMPSQLCFRQCSCVTALSGTMPELLQITGHQWCLRLCYAGSVVSKTPLIQQDNADSNKKFFMLTVPFKRQYLKEYVDYI
jgi:hypothetical protein